MKDFVKDYVDLCKDSGRFYKKHWKGVVVLNAIMIAGEMAWLNKQKIKANLEEKFVKNGESK